MSQNTLGNQCTNSQKDKCMFQWAVLTFRWQTWMSIEQKVLGWNQPYRVMRFTVTGKRNQHLLSLMRRPPWLWHRGQWRGPTSGKTAWAQSTRGSIGETETCGKLKQAITDTERWLSNLVSTRRSNTLTTLAMTAENTLNMKEKPLPLMLVATLIAGYPGQEQWHGTTHGGTDDSLLNINNPDSTLSGPLAA